jgi:hypothetical protein
METIDLYNWLVSTPVCLVVEVDCENGRPRTHKGLSMISLVDLEHVGGDDILPAMVFEIPHCPAPFSEDCPGGTRSRRVE